MIRVDNLAFLDEHGMPPTLSPELELNVAHATAAPPFFTTTEQILNGATAPNGIEIIGVNGFRDHLKSQNVTVVEASADIDGVTTSDADLRVIMGIQGSPHDATSRNIARLRQAGLRVMGIGYQSADHPYGAGFSDPAKGLTPAGRDYLDNLAENGMILDLSHSGHQTAYDALEYARDSLPELPVFASHTGILEASGGHNRNFPLEILQGIKERGGIVGIYALTFALHSSDNSLDPMIEHINTAIAELGPETVAIGTDGIYHHFSEEERQAQFVALSNQLDPTVFSARYPSEPDELNTPDKMGVLFEALRYGGYGHNRATVEGVIGLNSLRFYQSAIQ